MAATVAELLVKIGANSSGLQKEIQASQRQLKRAFGPDALAASETAVGVMAGLSAGIVAVGGASIKMAADMEQSRIAFTTMLGSAQKAESFLRDLASFAEKTPFEFVGLTQSSKKLLAFGFQASEIIPVLTSIGDAVAAVGGTAEVLDRVTLAFGQMKTKGRVSAQEMNQLAEAGIPAWEFLAKTIGTDVPTAMDMAENKALDAETAIAGMIAQMGERFGGMMDKQSRTITGILSNIKDKSGNIMRDMGDEIVVALDLQTKMQASLDFLDTFAARVRRSGVKEAMIEMVPESIVPGIYAISGAITAVMIPALKSLAASARLALAPLLPVIAIGAALGLVVYSANATQKAMGEATIEADMFMESFSGKSKEALQAANLIEGGLSRIGDQASYTVDEIISATDKVKEKVSSGLGAGAAGGEWEKLETLAKQTSESIEREWVQLTQTQIQQLGMWKDEQLNTLEKTKSANMDYVRDVQRVWETYEARKKKIDEDEYNRLEQLRRSAKDSITSNKTREIGIGITGVDKQILDLQSGMESEIQAITREYEDMVSNFATLDAQAKANNIKVWQEAGIAFKANEDGTVDFTEQAEKDKFLIRQDYAARIEQLHYDTQKHKENIDKAYANGSILFLTEELNSERAILAADLSGRQEMIDEYYDVWKETHRTSMSYMAEAMGDLRSGMASTFKDIIKGVDGAKSAWVGFRDTVIDIIAEIYAKQMAANLTSSIMSVFGIGGGDSKSSNGSSSGSGVGFEWYNAFASGGSVYGPGTSTSDSIMAMLSNGEYVMKASIVDMLGVGFFDALNTGQMPAFATGGLVTGPSLSSVSGNYSSATSGKFATANSGPQIIINNYTSAQIEQSESTDANGLQKIILDITLDGAARDVGGFGRNMKAVLGAR